MRARRDECWVVVRMYGHLRLDERKALVLIEFGSYIHRRHRGVSR